MFGTVFGLILIATGSILYSTKAVEPELSGIIIAFGSIIAIVEELEVRERRKK